MRTALYANKSIKNFLGNQLPNIDFFFHTWDIQSEKRLFDDVNPIAPYLNKKFECLHKFLEVIKFYKPKKYEVEIHDDYSGSLEKNQQYAPLWYSWYKSLQLIKEYEKEMNFEYDVIIKMRFDVIYKPNLTLDELFVKHIEKINEGFFFTDSIWEFKDELHPHLIHDVFFMHNSKIVDKLNHFYLHHILKSPQNYDVGIHRIFGTFLKENEIPFDQCLPEIEHLWAPLREMSLNFFDPNVDFKQLVECNRILYNHDYQSLNDVQNISLDTLIQLKNYTLKHMNYAPNVLGKLKPLKIAICMSGQLRTWDKCYQNIFKIVNKLERKEASIDFFCHSWDFESESSPVVANTGNDEVFIHNEETLDKVLTTYRPKDYLFENYEKNQYVVDFIKKEGYKYKNQTPITWSSQQFYSMMRASEIKRKYEIENNLQYDVCIRLRYDQYIPESQMDYIISMIFSVEKNTVMTMHNRPHSTYPFTVYGDVFWISDSLTYDKIAMFYKSLPTIDHKLFKEGTNTPPENVLTHFIKESNIKNKEMMIDIRICKTKEFIKRKLDLGLPGLGNHEIFYEDIINDDDVKFKMK